MKASFFSAIMYHTAATNSSLPYFGGLSSCLDEDGTFSFLSQSSATFSIFVVLAFVSGAFPLPLPFGFSGQAHAMWPVFWQTKHFPSFRIFVFSFGERHEVRTVSMSIASESHFFFACC